MATKLPSQPALLAPVAPLGRVLVYDLRVGKDPRAALARVAGVFVDTAVLGLGLPLALALGAKIDGLRAFPSIVGPGTAFPSTQASLWICAGAADAPALHDLTTELHAAVDEAFSLHEEVAMFRYREGRDLTGYVDGSANPEGDLAATAALVDGAGAGLDGGSFVAVQRWIHDLGAFARLDAQTRDHVIGRRISDNEEIEDAPEWAHVKRAEQEDYDPPAFMVRRSMPWGGAGEKGIYFVAYGRTLDPFERVLTRMSGKDDGVVDGLLRFSRAVSGGYYFCPPVRGAARDLRAFGLG